MAENTGIEWAHHTFNPWIGCTKVSPGCDHCYAETMATNRLKVGWGPQAERRRTAPSTWRQPLAWNRRAEREGRRERVFCASLADVFDHQVPEEWRTDLWRLISETPHLDWLLLTKRPQNIAKMLPASWAWPPLTQRNLWLGTTVENQKEADRRIPHLLAVPAKVRFLSCEPLLGPVDLTRVQVGGTCDIKLLGHPHVTKAQFTINAVAGVQSFGWRGLDWVIAGGESGPGARPMHPGWARSLRDQCAAAGVAFFFKQWGEWAPGECNPGPMKRSEEAAWWLDGWDFDRVTPRELEEMHCDDGPDVWRFGKKAAGRLLDGREHNEVPLA